MWTAESLVDLGHHRADLVWVADVEIDAVRVRAEERRGGRGPSAVDNDDTRLRLRECGAHRPADSASATRDDRRATRKIVHVTPPISRLVDGRRKCNILSVRAYSGSWRWTRRPIFRRAGQATRPGPRCHRMGAK